MPFSDSESLGSKWVILMHLLTLDQSTINKSFLQSRSNPSAVTSGVRAQFQLLEDIRENTTIKISPN